MDKSQKYAGPAPSGVASYDMKPLKNGPSALEIENATMQSTHRGRKQTEMYGGPGSKGYIPPGGRNEKMDDQGRIPGVKYMATDAQMRDYKRNKPVNTPAGRARYADKAPKINLRKAYQD